MKTFYRINYKSYTFDAEITEEKERHIIKFGGREKTCVMITIYQETDVEQPHIDGLHYGKDCIVKGDLEPKHGTIDMVKAALSFACQRYPQITSFTLKDDSSISCQKAVKVPLGTYYLAKHGKTWYDTHFNAYIENTKSQKQYQKMQKFNKHKVLPKHFEAFWNEHIAPYISMFRKMKTDDLKDTFEEIWNESSTYQDFFRGLAEIDCILFQIWVHQMYVNMGWNMDVFWVLPKIEEDITVTPLAKGGRNFKIRVRKPKMNFGKMYDCI